MACASGRYSNLLFKNFKIDELVEICHRELSEKSGWKFSSIMSGQFGYDNLVESIGHALTNWTNDEDKLAELIHTGWINNYTFWRDNRPWELFPGKFKRPNKPLGDERREKCAVTPYQNLDIEEKEKDLIIARKLIEIFR